MCSNPIANALELPQSCTKPSIRFSPLHNIARTLNYNGGDAAYRSGSIFTLGTGIIQRMKIKQAQIQISVSYGALTSTLVSLIALQLQWHLWPLLLTWINFNPSMDK